MVMAETSNIKNIGLRGVKVADTRISDVDGTNGILIYRGFPIEELAEHSTFEETSYLLLHDDMPTVRELREFTDGLRKVRSLPAFVPEVLAHLPKGSLPMDVLQAAVPLLAMDDPDLADDSREANLRKAGRLIARVAAVVAAWHRIRNGQDILLPDDGLSSTTRAAADGCPDVQGLFVRGRGSGSAGPLRHVRGRRGEDHPA